VLRYFITPFVCPRFFAGYKLHFFLYLSQFLGTMTCIRRAVLHVYAGRCYIYALAQRLRRCLSKRNCLSETRLGDVPRPASHFENPISSRIVHAYSCCQSENMSFLCLLKHVIDLACLITSFDTIITPLELLVKNFFLTFSKIISMIGL